MLQIADQIGAINESQMNAGKARVEADIPAKPAAADRHHRADHRAGLAAGGVQHAQESWAWKRDRRAAHREIFRARGQELKQLSARLVEAQENERRSISRELHDEVGQALTGVLVEMANLSTLIRAGDKAALAAKADEIKKRMENSISVVRNMALLLRPSMLDDLGLVPALQWQAREVSKRSGVWVKVAAEQRVRGASRRAQDLHLPRSCRRPCTISCSTPRPAM